MRPNNSITYYYILCGINARYRSGHEELMEIFSISRG